MDTAALPSHLRIAAALRQRLAAPDLPPGGFLPAERELAIEFGVSRNTLRRAIRTLADEGLVEVSSNCRPRIATRQAAGDATALAHLAIFTPVPFAGRIEPGSGEFVNLSAAVVVEAQRAGLAVVYVNSTGKDLSSPAAAARLFAPFYRGIIVHAEGGAAAAMIGALEAWGGPAVVVAGGIVPAATNVHTVDLDQEAGTTLACRHLLEAGRRRIVHLTYDEPHAWVEARVAAYRAAMLAAKREPEVLRVASVSQINLDDQRAAIRRRIAAALPGSADAVLGGNDFLASCVAQEARSAGRRVPAELAIVGFDDVNHAVENDLTSVASMAYELGRRAARIAIDAIAGGGACHRERVAPRLILRGSSPAPA